MTTPLYLSHLPRLPQRVLPQGSLPSFMGALTLVSSVPRWQPTRVGGDIPLYSPDEANKGMAVYEAHSSLASTSRVALVNKWFKVELLTPGPKHYASGAFFQSKHPAGGGSPHNVGHPVSLAVGLRYKPHQEHPVAKPADALPPTALGACGGDITPDQPREVHGLCASRKHHVTPWDDVSSPPGCAPGAAEREKSPVLVCMAMAAPVPGQTV
eukprot:superscaffoldBa00000353_g4043